MLSRLPKIAVARAVAVGGGAALLGILAPAIPAGTVPYTNRRSHRLAGMWDILVGANVSPPARKTVWNRCQSQRAAHAQTDCGDQQSCP
jgi:hypothetical protein